MTVERETNAPCAALILVGDELLSAKIRDENGPYFASVMRERGLSLVEIVMIRDDIGVIAQTLLRLAQRARWIVTSGGVGPTHDDLTVDGIAAGLGREVVQHPILAQQLREHYGENCNEAVLRMARVPQGAQLYGPKRWPVLGVPFGLAAKEPTRNSAQSPAQSPAPTQAPPIRGATAGDSHRVYLLPGIPSLFRKKIEALAQDPQNLPRGPAWELAEFQINRDESHFSAQLNEVVASFPAVQIGSYPKWIQEEDGSFRVEVRLTFESRIPGRAQQARDDMARRWSQSVGG